MTDWIERKKERKKEEPRRLKRFKPTDLTTRFS
jgi:hypothetical protein